MNKVVGNIGNRNEKGHLTFIVSKLPPSIIPTWKQREIPGREQQ
jgi:hypothetical protein